MTFETIENVLNINTDAIMTLAMAAVLLVIGYFIKNKLTILDRYCIPAPVVGGFLFMFITWIWCKLCPAEKGRRASDCILAHLRSNLHFPEHNRYRHF